jgi:Cu+-exporting ATPase
VSDVIPFAGWTADEILGIAASLESRSEHPLAEAVLREARNRKIDLEKMTEFEALPGLGIKSKIGNRRILLGNVRLLQEYQIETESFRKEIDSLSDQGKTAVVLAVDGVPAGMVAFSDPVKRDAAEAVRLIKGMGIRTVLLTGDNRQTAEAVAREIGVEKVHAEVLPQKKADIVLNLKTEGRIVAMVGDGINDAPALAKADVGIAFGSGADIAAEAADATLMRSDLGSVVDTILLSRKTVRVIRQNLFWAFIYNVIGIPIAAGALFPIWGIQLNPALAALAMSMSSVSVVTNSLRLRRMKSKNPAANGGVSESS